MHRASAGFQPAPPGAANKMRIERVSVQGFKSFTRLTVLQFCEGFTCVTGANGSGKSNIMDAISFAMAEDNLSRLRVKQFSDLVSSGGGNITTATVKVDFREESAGQDSFSVEASVDQNGVRVYKVDGIKRSAADVRERCKQHEKQKNETKILEFTALLADTEEEIDLLEEQERIEQKIRAGEASIQMARLAELSCLKDRHREQVSYAKSELLKLTCSREISAKPILANTIEALHDARLKCQSSTALVLRIGEEQAEAEEILFQARTSYNEVRLELTENLQARRELSDRQDQLRTEKLHIHEQIETHTSQLLKHKEPEPRSRAHVLTDQDAQQARTRGEQIRELQKALDNIDIAFQRISNQRDAAQICVDEVEKRAVKCGVPSTFGDDTRLLEAEVAAYEIEIATLEAEVAAQVESMRRLNISTMRDGSGATCVLLLHRLRFSPGAEAYLLALSIIAGSKLRAIVCASTAQATQEMKRQEANHHSINHPIWVLDRLESGHQTRDNSGLTAAESAVVAKLTPNHAALPADVCHFDFSDFTSRGIEVNSTPFLRVYGGVVLSRTPHGSQVLRDNNIPFIELDGTRSDPRGMLSGGYTANEDTLLSREFDYKQSEATKDSAVKQIRILQDRVKYNCDILSLADTLNSAHAELGARSADVMAVQKQKLLMSEQLTALKREEQSYAVQVDDSNVTVAKLKQSLQHTEKQLLTTNDDIQALSRRHLDLEERAGHGDRAVNETQQKLAEKSRAKRKAEESQAESQALCKELETQLARTQQHEAAQNEENRTTSLSAVTCSDLIKSGNMEIRRLDDEIQKLTAMMHIDVADIDQPNIAAIAACKLDLSLWKLSLADIVSRLGDAKGCQVELRSRANIRKGLKAEFVDKSEKIAQGLDKLVRGMEDTLTQRNIANLNAFKAVAASFADFFSQLCPSKAAEIRLGPRGTTTEPTVMDEIHFVVRSATTASRWNQGTLELSGGELTSLCKSAATEKAVTTAGQRTLLGLAFVLAIATYRPSPLYILDEVDAALDEGNQAKVAALVAQVLGTQCRCQTIAISHHVDFQRGAARVVQIAKRGCESVVMQP